jgi:type IV secretion system protein VirD4
MKNDDYHFGKYVSNDNNSRWADSSEIMNADTIKRVNIEADDYPGAGIPVISDGRIAYVDNSDTHTLIFGSTGSKKTRLFGMPLINILAMAGESFIATDPKGELFHKTSGLVAAKGYKTIVLNFRDLKQSDLWNPLTIPYELFHNGKTDEAVSLINDLITALADPQQKNTKDTYFIDLARSQALANMLFFIETASKEQANIYNFSNFFASTPTADATERLADYVTEGSIASINYKGVLTNKGADRTFANVSSCVSAMLGPFTIRKTLCQALSQSSFDVRDLGNSKTAIYIIVPDEKTTLHFLVTAFIKQTYEALINEAQQEENKKLPVRLNLLLDEFCNIPTIPDMASMISAARSRNMRFFLLAQSQWQLKQKYKEDAETIKGNCDNWVFLSTREFDLLKEISNLCGDTFYKDAGGTIMTKPLISPSELQRFKKELGEALIFHGRNYPFVTELADIDEYKFKVYPPLKTNKRRLPKIVLYDVNKVIESIRNKERPIPFSVEVYGKEKYYEEPPADSSKKSIKDIFDW